MKTIINYLLLLSIFTFVTTGCQKDTEEDDEIVTTTTPTPTPSNLLKVGETYILGAKTKAIIYADAAFVTGYNYVYVAFSDSVTGAAVNHGFMTLNPMMVMSGGMTHSAPIENNTDSMPMNGFYKAAVVFTMVGTASEWSLNIDFENMQNGFGGTGSIGVDVIASSPAAMKSTTHALDSDAKVFISIIHPMKPIVGMNDFEIVVHKKQDLMNFPAVTDYTVEIEPEMPSMGHGSPNNVNPIHTGNGHYVGKANFTMTGLWQINLSFYKNGVLLGDDQYFEMTVN